MIAACKSFIADGGPLRAGGVNPHKPGWRHVPSQLITIAFEESHCADNGVKLHRRMHSRCAGVRVRVPDLGFNTRRLQIGMSPVSRRRKLWLSD